MADRNMILETLREQRARFTNQKVAQSFKGWTRTMQYYFPDLDLRVTLPVNDGVPGDVTEGAADGASINYEMSSDTFLAIHRKEISGMSAFSKKLVKVKASMQDLLKLQKLDSV